MNILNSANHLKPRLIVFTPFTFTINGGINVSGTASNYPITFNPVTPANTYGTITNFNKNEANGKSFTIYFKTRTMGNQAGGYVFNFTSNNETTTSTSRVHFNYDPTVDYGFFDYKVPDSIQVAANIGDTYSGNLTTSPNQCFHMFLVFNSSNNQLSLYTYNSSSQNVENLTNKAFTTSSSIWFDSLNYFWLAYGTRFGAGYGAIRFDKAGWYNTALTSVQILAEVNKSPS